MGCCPHVPALSWELDVPALPLPALPFDSVLSDESAFRRIKTLRRCTRGAQGL
jgi:hypothetical protein